MELSELVMSFEKLANENEIYAYVHRTCMCSLCLESIVGSSSSVVCVYWHGSSMAKHGS